MKSFEREWQSRFETFARHHQEEHLISGWSRRGLTRRVEIVSGLLAIRPVRADAMVLDLGCGSGTYVRLLSKSGHRVVGLDYSRPSLQRALEADPGTAGRYLQGEAYHLPFRDETFDVVLAIGVFLALGSPEAAIEEMARVLRPGGILILEALNAHELVARLKQLRARLGERPDPVRAYPPALVRRWLAARDLHAVARAGVYIPPRRPAWLAWIVEQMHLLDIAARLPLLSTLGAHAYLTLAEKRGRGPSP